MYAGPRMLVIRRKKMRKFKRKKRIKRDYFILQKRQLKKKLKVYILLNFMKIKLFYNLKLFRQNLYFAAG